MNIYGERFAEVGQFISHCRELNVKTNRRELEHYEKTGVMLPVARVVYPHKYVVEKVHRGPSVGSEWPALARLQERNWDLAKRGDDVTYEDLFHCFDREIGTNRFLSRPTTENFQPWNTYSISVPTGQGEEVNYSNADHYYSYWQVHQLYLIQTYPDLYENKWLIDQMPEDNEMKRPFPRALNTELLAEFKGMRRFFDALSFWNTAYGNEQSRTFANIDEMHGFKQLNDFQAKRYEVRLRGLARLVIDRFGLTRQDLYGFLRQLVDLYEDYRRDERFKLSDELKKDIFCCEDVIELHFGDTREKMEQKLLAYWSKRTFRHLDIATKERDYALDIINLVAEKHSCLLRERHDTNWSFTEEEANGLLDYCEREGLGLLVTALSGMVAIGNEEHRHKFRRVQRYTNLKNILTSYEYLLKSLGQKAGLDIGGKTLAPAIRDVMCKERWFTLFEANSPKGFLHSRDTVEFLNKLETLRTDKQLNESMRGYWAQTFLGTCLARNYTVHSYPSDDRYYDNFFGTMLDAVLIAMFYTWKLAKRKNWV